MDKNDLMHLARLSPSVPFEFVSLMGVRAKTAFFRSRTPHGYAEDRVRGSERGTGTDRMLGEPTPHDADPTGEQYAFERRVTNAQGAAEPELRDYAEEAHRQLRRTDATRPV